ncbi:hypothetical protein AB0399_35920, partial [Streptomyces sp. NPDC088194]
MQTGGAQPDGTAATEAGPGAAPGAASGSVHGAGSAPAAGTAAVRPSGPPGWSALPPIQRASAHPSRHTIAAADFGGTLSAWQNPSFTGELAHVVLDDAPTGLIRDVLTPAPAAVHRTGQPPVALPVAVVGD